MQPKDPDSVTSDPQGKRGDEPGPRSQPHATTSDQIAEMESEGQAAKPGTSEQREPAHSERPRAKSGENTEVSPADADPDRSESDQDIDTAGTEADPGSANARQVRKDPAGSGQTDDVRGDVAWQEPAESRRGGETGRGTGDRQKKVLPH